MSEKEVRQIIFCRGIPGSGKSTWAKKWVQEWPDMRVRFNNDDIRLMLGKYWVPEREHIITSLRKTFLKESLKAGYEIVIDCTNLEDKNVNELIRIINKFKSEKYDYWYEFKDFFTPLQECIERDSIRKHPIGREKIIEIFNKHKELVGVNTKITYYIEEYIEDFDCWGKRDSYWSRIKGMFFDSLEEAKKTYNKMVGKYPEKFRIINDVGEIF